MQRYVDQLIEDLEAAAANPPTPAYIEAPPHLEEYPDLAELALVPYKTIQELTGIDENVFPLIWRITEEHIELINAAIFKVYESLNIELIDKPSFIPPEYLYEALVRNWRMYIQYLPTSGYDLELCTRNIETCPYDEFCEYCNAPEFDEDEDMPTDSPISENDNELPF